MKFSARVKITLLAVSIFNSHELSYAYENDEWRHFVVCIEFQVLI